MPGLVAFRRRWMTGSDDLVLPGALLFILHVILFSVIAEHVVQSSDLQLWANQDIVKLRNINANESDVIKAKCAHNAQAYALGYIGLLVAAIVLEVVMVAFSMQGSILNPKPREAVEYVLYARIVVGITEIVYSCFAIANLAKNWIACSHLFGVFHIQAVIVSIDLLVLILVLVVALCTYDSTGGSFYRFKKCSQRGSISQEELKVLRDNFYQNLQTSWIQSLRRCCCCMRDSQNTKVALEEASHILYKFFRYLDVVPSDIAAGLLLLKHKQSCSQKEDVNSDCRFKEFQQDPSNIDEYLCGRPITSDTVFLDSSNPHERERFNNLMYYCNYAIASYGPLFYLAYNPVTGLCKLMNECMCVRCCRGDEPSHFPTTVVQNDTCCEWQTSAMKRSLKGNIDNADIVYVSWDNDVYKQPFFVSVDHEKKSIVVTIRGTLSELDALTDIAALAIKIPVQGNEDGSWRGHKGMVEGAKYIQQQLLNEMILSQAFGRDLTRGTRDYNLVIVGHSLGAGVAAVLAILLRPKYPDVICYSYAPPGGLLTLSAVRASKDFINTAAFGKDLVIRGGLPQLEKMKEDVLSLLRRTNLPKYKILLGNFLRSSKHRHSLLSSTSANVASLEAISLKPPDDGRSDVVVELHEELYPPGRILHIVYRSKKQKSCCGSRSKPETYFAIEADNVTDFQEILVSYNMIRHHWPQELLKAMKKVVLVTEPNDAVKRYSQSATLPSQARLPSNHDEGTRLLEGSSPQPDIVMETLRDVGNLGNHSVHRAAEEDEEVRAPLARIDSYHESSSTYSEESALSPSSVKTLGLVQTVDTIAEVNEIESANRNNNNSHEERLREARSATTDDKHIESVQVTSEKQPDIAGDPTEVPHFEEDQVKAIENRQSTSLIHRFGDYLDVVLHESDEDSQEVKYARSKSMPGHNSVSSADGVDQDMAKRAQFEPNVIPKPPRTHSFGRRPNNLLISRDYSSAPPSRTTTPQA